MSNLDIDFATLPQPTPQDRKHDLALAKQRLQTFIRQHSKPQTLAQVIRK